MRRLGFLDLRHTSAIIATPSQTFAPRPPESALASCLETALAWLPLNLPASLAFLSSYGVDPLLLLSAAGEARAQAVAPETACLRVARYKSLSFISVWRITLAPPSWKVLSHSRRGYIIHLQYIAALRPSTGRMAGAGCLHRAALCSPSCWQGRGRANVFRTLRSRLLRRCPACCARMRLRRCCGKQVSASPISIRAFPRKLAQAGRNALSRDSHRCRQFCLWHGANIVPCHHLLIHDVLLSGLDLAVPVCRDGEHRVHPGAVPARCRRPLAAGLFSRRRAA
jgi:hypothetical protein